MGTGNPNRAPHERSKDELMNLARERQVSGRSSMTKGELVEALQR
jgi:hypothetical protein